jgi:hypothetical protein
MVRATRNQRSGRSDRDGDGDDRHEHEHGRERHDDPEEHLEIERRRFHGGLKPTPDLYALAREQWYRLPGSVVRPSMDTNAGDTNAEDNGAGDREPDQ